ncbi:MAG: CDP-alcohol phosphatidyltransferase family protein [Muribaculaceae bacterium]|nr:CDP-alcohol phosphatidyltransferase family protein [Muribaculaceae bacterium]
MGKIIRNIPNCITLLNLVAGTMAIICAFKGVEPLWGLRGWEWGAIFIGIGAVADFLDGFFARVLKAYSELGKELDSLCDLVSFGVAPSLLVFNLLDAAGAEPWLKWFMLIVPAIGAVRLARFNIDIRQSSFFTGLPVPANAIFWIGFCALCTSGAAFLTFPVVFLAVLAVESWLMISPLKLLSLKFHDYKFSGVNLWRYFLILAAVVLVFCMGVGGLLWLIVAYVCLSVCVKVS